MPELWTPQADMPHEAFVERLHRAIGNFAASAGVEKPLVELGWTLVDAERALAEVDSELPPEERVRLALKKAA